MSINLKANADGVSGAIQVNGVDAVVFNAGGVTSKILPFNASVAGNALTMTLAPTPIDFRSTNPASGTVTTVSNAVALSLVAPVGASIGSVNAVLSRLLVVVINNAGVSELAVINQSGGTDISETGVISTTAISASATANNVFYSNTARTSVSYRVVGYVDIVEATAGTWLTPPTVVQGTGGQALTALSSYGSGQTWQNLTGSRALNTTYTNPTGKMIKLSLIANLGNTNTMIINVSGITIAQVSNSNTSTQTFNLQCEVPAGATYSSTGTTAIGTWNELR